MHECNTGSPTANPQRGRQLHVAAAACQQTSVILALQQGVCNAFLSGQATGWHKPQGMHGGADLALTLISALVGEAHGAHTLPPVVNVLSIIHSALGAPSVLAMAMPLTMLHAALVCIT